MRFVDYLSRHPTSKPITISEYDKKCVTVSPDNIGMLLDFDKAMRKPQLNNFRVQFFSCNLQSVKGCCNLIIQS